MNELIELNEITGRIYTIRGLKHMMDRDLAEQYEVETRAVQKRMLQIEELPMHQK